MAYSHNTYLEGACCVLGTADGSADRRQKSRPLGFLFWGWGIKLKLVNSSGQHMALSRLAVNVMVILVAF